MFGFSGSVQEEWNQGRARTFVYGRIPSVSKGDGEVTCLVSGVRMEHSTLLYRLWVSIGLGVYVTEDNSFIPIDRVLVSLPDQFHITRCALLIPMLYLYTYVISSPD